MSTFNEVYGDFWKAALKGRYNAIVCTINGQWKNNDELVMGAGIAKDFKERFPSLPKEWGRQVINDGLGILVTKIRFNGTTMYAIALPTKYHWKEKSDVNLIKKSLKELVDTANKMNLNSILMTRPGTGMGGLSWEHDIKSICNWWLDDRFYICDNAKKDINETI